MCFYVIFYNVSSWKLNTKRNNYLLGKKRQCNMAQRYCLWSHMKGLRLQWSSTWSRNSGTKLLKYSNVEDCPPCSLDVTPLIFFFFFCGDTWNSRCMWPLFKHYRSLSNALWMVKPTCHALCSNICNMTFKRGSTCALGLIVRSLNIPNKALLL